MIMSRKLFNWCSIVALTFALISFISCGSEDAEDELHFQPSAESSSYFTKGMVVPADGLEVTISFSTNKSWRASTSDTWCKLSPSDGKAGNISLVITVEQNKELTYRQCTINISADGKDNSIAVTQAGANSLLIEVPQAGMLSALLRDQIDKINILVVKGELNGTDFKVIRKRATNLHLDPFSLDLTDSRIVEGGEPYSEDNSIKLYTKNDVITERLLFDCENLQELKLPSTTKRIEKMAFHFVELQTLDIPASTTWIDNDAFYEFKVLELHMHSSTPPSFNPSSFYASSFFSSTKCTLYVPIGSKKAYENAYGSNTFKAVIEE